MAHIQTQYAKLYKPQDLSTDRFSSQKMCVDNINNTDALFALHGSMPTSLAVTDAYTITVPWAISQSDLFGVILKFIVQVANTAGATLNVNNFGAKPIYKGVSSDLETGDIIVGGVVLVVWDGTRYQLLGLGGVTKDGVQILTNKTLDSPKMTSAGAIKDANGNELIKVPASIANAVNELTVSNAVTGSAPSISATGDDANIDIILAPKGTGKVKANDIEILTEDDVVDSPAPNKLIRLNDNELLPVSITGNADTLDSRHMDDFMQANSFTSEDLNNLDVSGVYRLRATNANMPNSVADGQLLVLHDNNTSDTITQIAMAYEGNDIFTRCANGSHGNWNWSTWEKLWSTKNLNPQGIGSSSLATTNNISDCNLTLKTGFYYAMSNTTNVPTGCTDGTLLVLATTEEFTQQIFFEWAGGSATGRTFRRQKCVGEWKPWYQFWDTANCGGVGDFVQTPRGASRAIEDVVPDKDLNKLITTGFFKGHNMTNAPDQGWWYILVELHDSNDINWIKQTATAYGSDNTFLAGTILYRITICGVWTAWTPIWTATGESAVRASGANANIDINLIPKGTGRVKQNGVKLVVQGEDYRPNILINGDFKINQRGKSSYPDGNQYSVDRWLNFGANTVITPKSDGITLASSWTGDTNLMVQRAEDYAKYAGRILILSIKYKNLVIGNSPDRLMYYISDGAGGPNANLYATSPTSGIVTLSYLISTNPSRLVVGLTKYGTSSVSVDFEWIKLEVNDHATPFIPRSVAEELALCQRYYETSYNNGVTPGSNSASGALFSIATATGVIQGFQFKTKKRTTPTVTIYSPSGTINRVWGSMDSDSTGTTMSAVNIGESGVRYIGGGNNVVGTSQTFHFVADAEI